MLYMLSCREGLVALTPLVVNKVIFYLFLYCSVSFSFSSFLSFYFHSSSPRSTDLLPRILSVSPFLLRRASCLGFCQFSGGNVGRFSGMEPVTSRTKSCLIHICFSSSQYSFFLSISQFWKKLWPIQKYFELKWRVLKGRIFSCVIFPQYFV